MLGGISLWQLLIVLALVVLLFGTKKLRTLGSDLGSAVKGFKKSVSDEDADFEEKPAVESKEKVAAAEQPSAAKTEQKEPQ